jgi:hypothetical protein
VVLAEGRRFFSAQGSDQATRQAKALTRALGVGIDAVSAGIERKNVKGTARAAQEAAAGGERDVTDKNKGYNEAFDQVEAANDLALFANELPKILQDKAWADMSEEEAQAVVDEYYQSQLAGINPDSVYGKTIAEGILKQNASLLQTHRDVQAEKGQQERRIMIAGELRADYEANGTIDHAKLMDRLHTLVPGPGGRVTYLESVLELAEEMGDVSIIDSIPDKFPSGDPTGTQDPNVQRDLLDPGRSKAQAARTAMDKAAEEAFKLKFQTNRAMLWARDEQMAKAGDARVLENIAEGGTEGPNGEPRRYTKAQQKALYTKYLDATDKDAEDSVLLNDWINGDGIGYSQDEVDRAHMNFVERVQANIPEAIEQAGDEAVNDYITKLSLERGVVNGKLPSIYRDQLKVNLSNPEKFKQAAEMYSQLEAQERGFAETQIGDAQSRKLYAYNRYLADTGGSEEAAIELMRNHEAGRNGRFNAEIAKVNKTTVEEIIDSKPGWGDYATTSRLQRLVNDEVRFYVDMGFEPEIAGEYAIEHIARRTRRAGDHLYAADAGWGNDPQAVYDWMIENEATHRGVDADTLQIIPTGDPTRVRFVAEDSVLPETKTYPISIFTEDYNRFNSEAEQQRAKAFETSSADMKKEAEQRAFETRYPPNQWLEPGARSTLQAQQRERWAAMPAAEKQRLIENELVKP